MLHETVCRFKNYTLVLKARDAEVLGSQTPGLRDCVSFLDAAFSKET